MTYTDSQKKAIERIGNFLNDAYNPDNNILTLTGAAGTGKSTIIKEIIRQSSIRSVVVSAPTHQAKNVINKMTGYPGETIQALLGLRPNINMEDFDPTNVLFLPDGMEKISNYRILFVDECSMIGDYVDNLIRKLSKQHKVKVLYIGDKYQLMPVEKGQKTPQISPTFRRYEQVELTEIMRQDESNPANSLIHIAREDVINGTDKLMPLLMNLTETYNDKGEGYELRRGKDFLDRIVKLYKSDEAHQNPYHTKLLAFDNITVNNTNSFLRNSINPSPDIVVAGDIIKGYNTAGKETDVAPYFDSHIRNSEDYIITDVKAGAFKILKETYYLYECKTLGNTQPLYILHPKSKLQFEAELVKRHSNGVQYRSWKPFYDFKNRILVNYEVYNNFNDKVCKKDFDYGYSQTTHKSQGSTYENVGLYLPSFRSCYHGFTRRSLLYVAITRTSKTVLCYDN